MLTFKHIALVSCIPLVLLADGLVIKTGQTTEFYSGDDGTYEIGIPREYTPSDAGGVVTDTATGLEWQDDYSDNGGVVKDGNMSVAIDYCTSLSLEGNDWRVPSYKELRSLIDYSRIDEAAKTDAIFVSIVNVEEGNNYFYWTSTVVAGYDNFFHRIDMKTGSDGSSVGDLQPQNVRCVRGNPLPTLTFVRDDVLEVVYDNINDLTWQDNEAILTTDDLNWTQAIDYCNDLVIAQSDDWRLANINELNTISDRSVEPAINAEFTSTPPTTSAYWSSTDYAMDGLAKWIMYADRGTIDRAATRVDSKGYYTRCVRSGEIIPFVTATTEIVEETIAAITEMDADIFSNPNAGNALTNKLNSILDLIAIGEYQQALDKLNNDILPKTDGCTLDPIGIPDKKDWIKDCTEQKVVYDYVKEIIERLESLI